MTVGHTKDAGGEVVLRRRPLPLPAGDVWGRSGREGGHLPARPDPSHCRVTRGSGLVGLVWASTLETVTFRGPQHHPPENRNPREAPGWDWQGGAPGGKRTACLSPPGDGCLRPWAMPSRSLPLTALFAARPRCSAARTGQASSGSSYLEAVPSSTIQAWA